MKNFTETVIRTQNELDALPDNYDGVISIYFGTEKNPARVNRTFAGIIRTCGTSVATVFGKNKVTVCDYSVVDVFDGCVVEAQDESFVRAFDECKVTATDQSRVETHDNSSAECLEQSTVKKGFDFFLPMFGKKYLKNERM